MEHPAVPASDPGLRLRVRRTDALGAAMALWVFVWTVLAAGGGDPAVAVFAPWNVLPVAVWWRYARTTARAGHAARGPVVGVLLAIPIAVLYPAMWTAASSDANGSLAYAVVPIVLLVVTGAATVVADIVGGVAAWGAR